MAHEGICLVSEMCPANIFPVAMPARPQRLKLTIAYDGSAFKGGWQSQPYGTTVQDVMEAALRQITSRRISMHASGRTDTGVHALGQCAHVDLPADRSPAEWQRILNHNLPSTVRVLKCLPAAAGFNAQRSARGKVYRYHIRNAAILAPHEAARVWLVPGQLDEKKLRAAAALFVGKHDFGSFTVNKNNPGQEVRTITAVRVTKKGTLYTLTFEGEGFLYHMVRMLVGAIIRVATGQDDLAELRHRLHHRTPPRWKQAAPPGGLYLVKVLY
jgi:tRNA pseudouridine38-40 synthase